ncbi:MAG: glycosyltransferase, partial [Chloroflexi bacterium]|nr:glycosyltransferase [Chloroflexota bacterium]
MNSPARVSVIIPTHNGAETLGACLEALQKSSQPPYEIIVVDDASTDQSAQIAEQFDCGLIKCIKNIGAARAKNRGAQFASGEILFFTDDDVIVARDALEKVVEDFADPQIAGVVGLLAADIPFADFASNYKNLWMRFSYARLPRERIGVFYTSLAAMRREIFQAHGGFDENYRGASIAEDTEFGQRVWADGRRIVLDARVTATHSKQYTLPQVLRTDFLRARALTLMRLRKRGKKFFTSVPFFYQVAVADIFATLAIFFCAVLFNNVLLVAMGALLLAEFYALNLAWLGYLVRKRGIAF